MKNKLLRNVLICICVLFVVLTACYLFVDKYFERVFLINTWINGVYCTGKTVEEMNTELLADAEAPLFTIIDEESNTYEFSLQEVDYTLDYTTALQETLEKQQEVSWLYSLFEKQEIAVEPEMTFDKNKLLALAGELAFVKADAAKEYGVYIYRSEDGYKLYDGLNHRLNKDKMTAYLTKQVAGWQVQADLREYNCYVDIVATDKQEVVKTNWLALQDFLEMKLVYDMGAELIILDKEELADFVKTDQAGGLCFEEGKPVIDKNAVEQFINSLADAYNTYGRELTFTSTAGDKKTIPYVNYGTEIDSEKELDYLLGALQEQRSETHIPSYTKEAYARGKNDIGDTYIEVDMGNQHLYVYVDGELLVETDIVTGNVRRKMSTPEGVVHVYAKQRNRILRGPGYASFVKYWMPVKGGIGLHDASWRNKFGGEIYKTDGSHGCINIPRDVMGVIYENIEIGTPVLLFY